LNSESGGLKYQTLSRNGVTVMFAHCPPMCANTPFSRWPSRTAPSVLHDSPEDLTFERSDGVSIHAAPARQVWHADRERNRSDVVKLVSTYEMALYGIDRLRPTNGYESRRQQYLAEVSSTKIKAAAAASAIALVQTKLVSASPLTRGLLSDRRKTARRRPAGDAQFRRRIVFNSEEPESGKKF